MHIKFHLRFFVISAVFVVLCVVFGSNILLKKRVEINLVSTTDDQVLAADTENLPLFGRNTLRIDDQKNDTKNIVNTENKVAGDIAEFIPVTISHTVKEGETLQSIAEKYHADAQTIADFPNNKLGEDLQLEVGQIVIVPNGYVDDAPPVPPVAVGTGQFSWPAVGVVTQLAYSWHAGSIDIGLPMGTPIKAADNGKVIAVEHFTIGYGVHVIIDHQDGLTSLYAHLTSEQVTVGQQVSKGDTIGISGSTGRSTGPHLHFEVRRGIEPVDPMTLLPAQ